MKVFVGVLLVVVKVLLELGCLGRGRGKREEFVKSVYLICYFFSVFYLFICLVIVFFFWSICVINYVFYLYDLYYSSDDEVSMVWELGRYINNMSLKKKEIKESCFVYYRCLLWRRVKEVGIDRSVCWVCWIFFIVGVC